MAQARFIPGAYGKPGATLTILITRAVARIVVIVMVLIWRINKTAIVMGSSNTHSNTGNDKKNMRISNINKIRKNNENIISINNYNENSHNDSKNETNRNDSNI